jgi:ATP-dependent DNA helicase RecQ
MVLDDGWAPREGNDWGERRRLYYVAMTRARQTLTLLQWPRGGAPWLAELVGDWLHRSTPHISGEPAAALRYELLGFGSLHLGFAAQSVDHEDIAAAIAGLVTGAALQLVERGRKLVFVDAQGQAVAALANDTVELWRARLSDIVSVRVVAIITRRRDDEAADYRAGARRDAWHVVVPEVTLRG